MFAAHGCHPSLAKGNFHTTCITKYHKNEGPVHKPCIFTRRLGSERHVCKSIDFYREHIVFVICIVTTF